jgi:uncharacterized protein (DUF1499 family)
MSALGFEGEADAARAAILAVLEQTGARVVEAEENYIHAEFTTWIFRFVDDVEFQIDGTRRRVDFRSASRVGHFDLGTNRRRMRKLCRELVRRSGFFTFGEKPG